MAAPYTLDPTRPLQIGMVVLQADETLERDFRRLLPDDVELLVSRLPSAEVHTTENITAMERALTDAAALLPRGATFGAIGYGCTSGTAGIGAARVAERIRAGVACPHVSDPLTALVAACRAQGITRLGLLSPYTADVCQPLVAYLSRAGISCVASESFDIAEEARVVRVDRHSITQSASRLGKHADVDAVFISCTNLRTLECIDVVEAATDKPCLSSNLVLAWHMLALCGTGLSANAPGRIKRWRINR